MDFDAIVIGAGVIGLAAGAELAEAHLRTGIIEKNQKYGLETSSRNSEVIHSGIHYPSGSLKSQLCVEGNALLYEIAEKHNIYHARIGKLTIARDLSEIPILESLVKQAKQNEIPGVEMIPGAKVGDMVPGISAYPAIYTPTTGIINAHQLMDYLVFRFKNAGGLMACGEKVIAVESVQDGYRVSTTSGSESLTCRILINCAGLYADEISAIFGIHIPVHWAKGDYYSVLRSMPSKLLIYPVPSRNALGIHITPKLEGGIRIGPDIEYVQKKYPPYPCDEPSAFTVDETKKEVFIREIQDFLPGIRKEDLVPEMYGIRPKLQGPSDDFRDFLIRDEKESGFPGFINLIGIESPGLTSCIAIGRYVKNIVRDML